MKTKLRQFQLREYTYNGFLPTKPELGVTIQVDEDGDGSYEYTGAIRGFTVTVESGGQCTTYVRVLDYESEAIE